MVSVSHVVVVAVLAEAQVEAYILEEVAAEVKAEAHLQHHLLNMGFREPSLTADSGSLHLRDPSTRIHRIVESAITIPHSTKMLRGNLDRMLRQPFRVSWPT